MKIELKMRLKESSHNILKLYWYTADDEVILETRPVFKLRLPKDTYVIFLLLLVYKVLKMLKICPGSMDWCSFHGPGVWVFINISFFQKKLPKKENNV